MNAREMRIHFLGEQKTTVRMKRRNKNQTTKSDCKQNGTIGRSMCLAVFQSITIIHATTTAIKKITSSSAACLPAYLGLTDKRPKATIITTSHHKTTQRKRGKTTCGQNIRYVPPNFCGEGEKKCKENCNKKYRHDTLWLII